MFYSISRKPTPRIAKIEGIACMSLTDFRVARCLGSLYVDVILHWLSTYQINRRDLHGPFWFNTIKEFQCFSYLLLNFFCKLLIYEQKMSFQKPRGTLVDRQATPSVSGEILCLGIFIRFFFYFLVYKLNFWIKFWILTLLNWGEIVLR